MKSLCFPLLLLGLSGCVAPESIVINEFVASNVAGLTDDAGGTPDWIELCNLSEDDVALDGWFLSDDAGNPQRHGLDGLTVPGGGFLLLFASGDAAAGTDHLPFKLSSGGEQIVLSSAEGVVDSLSYGAQTADVSTARLPDGTGEWQDATPTPGGTNE